VTIQAYVINLKRRRDRREEFETRHSHLKIDFNFVEAVDGQAIEMDSHFSPNNVAACWLSHQKVAQLLLLSDDRYALVLEDDAILDSKTVELLERESTFRKFGVDLFQIGYNVQDNRVASGHRDSYLRAKLNLLCICESIFSKFLISNTNFCRNHNLHIELNLPCPCVNGLFETGTHAYIMSRKLAEIMLMFNNPVLLPADVALCELAKLENVYMARPSSSYSTQSDSVSSILEISNEVMETKLAVVMESLIHDYRQ